MQYLKINKTKLIIEMFPKKMLQFFLWILYILQLAK